ncbi:MAG: tetratricopeptide repeat protein [Kiritimatiellia bacterium]
MRRPLVFAAWPLAGWLCLAAAAGWRDAPLPPEAERLNRTADHAASAPTAVRLYAQSLKLAPSNGPALYGLGLALLDQNRPADALKVFRRLAALHPGEADVLEALAAAIARQPGLRRADVAEGRALAFQATQLQSDRPEAWHVLSVLSHLDGDYAAAAAAARRAVELDAQNPSDPETTALYQQQEIACTDALSVFSPLD